MRIEDFEDELAMRAVCQDTYAKLVYMRETLLKVDIVKNRANTVKFKGAMQFLDSAIETLTFEK